MQEHTGKDGQHENDTFEGRDEGLSLNEVIEEKASDEQQETPVQKHSDTPKRTYFESFFHNEREKGPGG
jgi:hypothetical protein